MNIYQEKTHYCEYTFSVFCDIEIQMFNTINHRFGDLCINMVEIKFMVSLYHW